MWKLSAAKFKAFIGLIIGAHIVDGDVPFYMKIYVKMTYPPPAKTVASNRYSLVASQP